MNISEPGLKIIKDFEGLRLQAYLDSGGVPTIGYGHIKGVKMGDTCTLAQAEAWLREETAGAVAAVNAALKVPVSQNQFDAMVSLAYNIGNEAFRNSTLLRMLNAGDVAGATGQFKRWNKDNGQVVKGLTNRRLAEELLFRRP